VGAIASGVVDLVLYVEALDDRRVGIGEQREADLPALGENPEDLDGVVV